MVHIALVLLSLRVDSSPPPVVTSFHSLKIGYSLPQKAQVALGYGWQLNPGTGKLFFHSGLDLVAPARTPVEAETVAFAGEQGSYGNFEFAIDL